MRAVVLLLALGGVCACSNTTLQPQPLSIGSPNLDSGIRGNGGDGLGGEQVVGKPTGGGLINRTTVP